MKLLIAGDLSVQHRAAKCVWNEENLNNAFCKVREMSNACDYAIVNLESPVTSQSKAILKDGPALKNGKDVLTIIQYCGFGIVTLANNHLKDYGTTGVIDTLVNCDKHGITTIGAGKNMETARHALVLKNDDMSVGILNVCEHESSVAAHNEAGAAPLDLPNLYQDIKKLKKEVSKVIVIIHGGCEHYQYPTPRMKREYRLIVEFGADIIVNHHQHCYSGYESYKGSKIFYGLGNFFFDNPRKRNDKWNHGLLLCLDLDKNKTDFQLFPIEQCNQKLVVEINNPDIIKHKMDEINAIIGNDDALEGAFEGFVAKKKALYPFLPYGNHYLRALYSRGLFPELLSSKRKVKIENTISCESHREVLLKYFEKSIKHE